MRKGGGAAWNGWRVVSYSRPASHWDQHWDQRRKVELQEEPLVVQACSKFLMKVSKTLMGKQANADNQSRRHLTSVLDELDWFCCCSVATPGGGEVGERSEKR